MKHVDDSYTLSVKVFLSLLQCSESHVNTILSHRRHSVFAPPDKNMRGCFETVIQSSGIAW